MVPMDCGLLTLLRGLSVLTELPAPGDMAAATGAQAGGGGGGGGGGGLGGGGPAGEAGGTPSGLAASELESSSGRRKAAAGLRRASPREVGRKSMAPSVADGERSDRVTGRRARSDSTLNQSF